VLEARVVSEPELRNQAETNRKDTRVVVEQAFLTLSEPDWGLALHVGRQTFEDERKWLYDVELDAIRGLYRHDAMTLELAVGRESFFDALLFDDSGMSTGDAHVVHGEYRFGEALTLGAYGILIDDRDPMDTTLAFVSIQSRGSAGDAVDLWFNAAHVRGRESGTEVQGLGIDTLAVCRFDAPLSPHLILGYAFGTADSGANDDHDGAFRQTGFQSNEVDIDNLSALRYYGETFDPELSNMSIFTAGLGLSPAHGLSIDLLYHSYRQDEPLAELRDAGISGQPTGKSRQLGSELDLALGYEPVEGIQIRGFSGYFQPGAAFGNGADDAISGRLKAEIQF
jgi:hypothetical protein